MEEKLPTRNLKDINIEEKRHYPLFHVNRIEIPEANKSLFKFSF